jgi:hypothetical protein
MRAIERRKTKAQEIQREFLRDEVQWCGAGLTCA